MPNQKKKNKKRRLVGVVVSDKMDKTVVVRVERKYPHPKYKKIVRSHKKYKAHDSKNQYKKGDIVVIEESRPMSKEKRWVVVSLKERREIN